MTKVLSRMTTGGISSMIRSLGNFMAAAIMTPNTAPEAPSTAARGDCQLKNSQTRPPMMPLVK